MTFRLLSVLLACVFTSLAMAQRLNPQQLLHPSGAADDDFGASTAISGDTIVVGAFKDDVNGKANQGSAHVYRFNGTTWTFEATLTAPDGAADDWFGYSTAISGNTIAVGAFLATVNGNLAQGAVYVYVRTGTTWTLQSKLTASNGVALSKLGFSVAIEGDTIISGAYQHTVGANTAQGSAYIFKRTGATWTQQAQLLDPTGLIYDQFGYSVAISGNTVVVGAEQARVNGNFFQGAAYVFTGSGSTWTRQTRLLGSDSTTNDAFGAAVAITGDTIAVGASNHTVGANNTQGSAYVFTRAGTTWTQQAEVTAPDGKVNDFFGLRLALSGETLLVGSVSADGSALASSNDRGAAYAFKRTGTAWALQSKLIAPDGVGSDAFGLDVAISGDTAVIGAYLDKVGSNATQGSAWVMSRSGDTWIGQVNQVLGPLTNPAVLGRFGESVAISGDTMIVGALSETVSGFASAGIANIYVRSLTGWTQQATLASSAPSSGGLFGYRVAISGDTAVVGAPGEDILGKSDQGAAYVYVRTNGAWSVQTRLTAATGAANDSFGGSVSIQGNTIVVGAPSVDNPFNLDVGAAYVFTRSGTTWSQTQVLNPDSFTPSGSYFGSSVAIANDTVLVGAPHNSTPFATVFTLTRGTWSQQDVLSVPDIAGSNFGQSVALSGNTALVGAPFVTLNGRTYTGSAYVFNRTGRAWTLQTNLAPSGLGNFDYFGTSVAITDGVAVVSAASTTLGFAAYYTRLNSTWQQLTTLLSPNPNAGDGFGTAVALDGTSVVVGARFDTLPGVGQKGSAWIFDVSPNDFSAALNQTTQLAYNGLPAALTATQTGQQLLATPMAFATLGTLDTLGRSLGFTSTAEIRTPTNSILTLGGSSSLSAAPGSAVRILGQLRASEFTDIYADSFLLGSRGTLTARAGSTLTINAASSSLEGTTRLEQGSTTTFAGSVGLLGPVTAALESVITTGGTLTNQNVLGLTTGTINTPLLLNQSTFNVFGTSALFGSLTNNAGALIQVRSGALFIFGSLINNGTIVGTTCSNCLGGPPVLDVTGDFTLGQAANLNLPIDDALVHVGGSVDIAINSNTRYDMAKAILQLEGFGTPQTLEVMSRDVGASAQGLDRTIAGNYPIGTLTLGPAPSVVTLVDARDNDGLGQGSCEALYVDALRITSGSRLINTSCKIYYNTLVNNGTIDVPANVIKLVASCRADFNADGFLTFEDFDAFVGAFEAGSANADFNSDGFLTFEDFDAFVSAFEVGC